MKAVGGSVPSNVPRYVTFCKMCGILSVSGKLLNSQPLTFFNMAEKHVRKLTKTGRGSRYVILPKELLDDLGWREHQKLTVERTSRGLLIKDWRKR